MNVLWQCPNDAAAVLVLAHGAGAGMAHQNMQAIADAFGRCGIGTLRFNFPFIDAGRNRTDSQEVATATIAAAFKEAQKRTKLPIWLGGHSFGGRMASHAVLDQQMRTPNKTAQERGTVPFCSEDSAKLGQSPAVLLEPLNPAGLVFCSFPLHPPGKPGVSRASHLPSIQQPMLFLSGTRDEFAERELLEQVVAELPKAKLHWLDTADHGYKVLKRTRKSTEDVFDEMARVAREFVQR